jgi:hypothetical protein
LLKNLWTSGNGLRYMPSTPEEGNPIAIILGVMYVRSKSKPSSVKRFFFFETNPRTIPAITIYFATTILSTRTIIKSRPAFCREVWYAHGCSNGTIFLFLCFFYDERGVVVFLLYIYVAHTVDNKIRAWLH